MPYFATNSSACCPRDSKLDQLTQILRLSLLHAQIGVDWVEVDQRITWLDPIADVVMNLDDAARPLAPDGHLLPPTQACQ